jgi:hypothetical protein
MTTTLPDAVARLERALDELALALVTVSPEPVLHAEESLGTAVTALLTARRDDVSDRTSLRDGLAGVRAAFDRCTALGTSAEAFTRTMFPQPAYGPRGLRVTAAVMPTRRASIT